MTLLQIRAAIKAVKAERSEPSPIAVKRKTVAARKVGSMSSTKKVAMECLKDRQHSA